MAPVQLEDPAVRRILDAVLPTENNPNDIVSEGLAGTESIGHIRVLSIDDDLADLLNIPGVSLFLGSSGLELLKFASERRKAYDEVNLTGVTHGLVWIFVEIHAGTGALAHLVVKVVVLPGVEESLAEEWIRDMRRALPGLPRALGMSHDEFYDRIDGALSDEYPSILGQGLDAIHEGLAEAFDLADETAKEFATFLETNSRMPPGLWDPRHQPKDWADFLDGLKAEQTPILDNVEQEVVALQTGFLKRFAGMGRILPNRLQAMLGRLSKMWNWLFGTIRGCIDLLRDMKPDLKETGAAVLGFVSGLWDGIMDAVIGFLEMLSLGFKLVAADLRRYDDVIARTVHGAGKVSNEPLGDGILGFEHDGILYVLTVFEMKSPSNRRHLLKGPVDTAEKLAVVEEGVDGVVRLLTAREGQISRDVARLAGADLFVDGVEILEGRLKFDRDITHFVGVMPKGKMLIDGDVKALQKIWKNFRQVEQTIPDEAIRVLAKELLRILSGK